VSTGEVMLEWALIVVAGAVPPFIALALIIATPSGPAARRRILALAAVCVTGALLLAADLTIGAWPAALVAGAWAARAGFELCRGRPPRRKRARRAISARARAVLASMMAALRSLARPRPAPVPVPR
jgi:hypothetical protein